MTSRLILIALPLALAACGGGGEQAPPANVSEDPFGATGAPGSDMTDKGVNDGASGPADNGQATATPAP